MDGPGFDYFLSVSRRAGATRLHLGTQRNDQAVMVVTLTGLAGMFGLGIAASAIDPASAAGFWAIVGGVGVAMAGTARLVWQRIARRWEGRLRDLAARLKSSVPVTAEAMPTNTGALPPPTTLPTPP